MADVFISYKAEDRKRIQPLVQALQADGLTVWWDEHIGTGDEWRETIERQLDEAKCVVVIWSKRSVGPGGRFVREEASRAQRRRAYVPVLIDAVEPPLGFGESQATSLRGWHGNASDPHYEAVLSAVRRITGAKARARSTGPVSGPAMSRRTALTGGAVVVVAGVGGWYFLKPSSADASNSIAVLPFENLSGDPSQAYFSDGLAEELRSALARAGLQVIGRTSSEAVKNDDARAAAAKLGVSNILTGSVRRSPTMIRVSAQLIKGSSGLERWSQDYNRNPGDELAIQTDIATNVAQALSIALGSAARAAIAVGGTSNPAAQDLYLKAKARLQTDDSENGLRSVIGLLDSAITLDPKFADAYAAKAIALSGLNGYYTAPGVRFEPGFIQAAAVARQAISLAPNLAAGHMALAYILQWQLDIGRAAGEYERGHALAGGNVDDLLDYGGFLAVLGRTDEAIDVARQAQARDPLNARAYASEGRALFAARRYGEAAASFRKALALAPDQLVTRSHLAEALAQIGRQDEALSELRKLPPDNLFRLVTESIIYARQGNRAASDASLQRAQQVDGDSANYQYAAVHAQRGENEQAFAALDRAWAFRDPGLAIAKEDRWLDPLRGDPRFAALLQKMNFPA